MSIEQGLRCLQGNKLQDALQVFNKLIILTPGNADLYLARAKTYMKLGDFTVRFVATISRTTIHLL